MTVVRNTKGHRPLWAGVLFVFPLADFSAWAILGRWDCTLGASPMKKLLLLALVVLVAGCTEDAPVKKKAQAAVKKAEKVAVKEKAKTSTERSKEIFDEEFLRDPQNAMGRWAIRVQKEFPDFDFKKNAAK